MIFPSHVGHAACKVKLILIHVVFYLYLFCFAAFFGRGGGGEGWRFVKQFTFLKESSASLPSFTLS